MILGSLNGLLVLIASVTIITSGQISPTWSASPFTQTRTIILTNGIPRNSTTYTQPGYYTEGFSTNWTSLAISDLSIVSNSSQMGWKVQIVSPTASNFTVRLALSGQTIITILKLRCMVVDQSMLNNLIGMQFYEPPIAGGQPIASGSGFRTMTASPAFTGFVATAGDTWVCEPFLVGFTATGTIYQINATCVIATPTTLTLTVTVDYDTNVTSLSYYIFLADIEQLTASSIFFVDYGTSKSANGSQYTFFSPTAGIYQNGYMVGLNSVTILDNQQFNFDLTASTYSNFTVSSSLYTDISHFHVRMRICAPPPYIYFSKLDNLCYPACPSLTYVNASLNLCVSCHYTCASCSNSTNCTTCKTLRNFNATRLCPCMDYYYEINQTCLPCHYSCKTCTNNQSMSCLTCSDHRTLSGSTCPCDAGYVDAGVSLCKGNCGDGNKIDANELCDDGNTLDGDGCSSICTIEANFTCDPGSPSACFYTGSLTLSIFRIEKDPFSNTGVFYLQISPWIDLMWKLANFQQVTNNLSSIIPKSISSESPYLIFKGQYQSDLEGNLSKFFLIPSANSSSPFSRISTTSVQFTANSMNGGKLLLYSSQYYTYQTIFTRISLFLGAVVLVSTLFFCLPGNKEIGNETFFIIQLIFLTILQEPYLTPIGVGISGLHLVMGYNSLFGQALYPYTKVFLCQLRFLSAFIQLPVLNLISYSYAFTQNFNLMVFIQVGALLFYLIYRIYLWCSQRAQQATNDPPNPTIMKVIFFFFLGSFPGTIQIMSVFKFDFFVYWTFFNLEQILLATCLQGEHPNLWPAPGIFAFVAICLISVLICILAIILRPESFEAYRKELFYREKGNNTFLIVLGSVFVLNILLIVATNVLKVVTYAMPAIPLLLCIYLAIRRPYKEKIQNVRMFVSYLALLMMYIFAILWEKLPESQTMYFPIILLVLVALVWIMGLVGAVMKMVNECRKSENENQQDNESISGEERTNLRNETNQEESFLRNMEGSKGGGEGGKEQQVPNMKEKGGQKRVSEESGEERKSSRKKSRKKNGEQRAAEMEDILAENIKLEEGRFFEQPLERPNLDRSLFETERENPSYESTFKKPANKYSRRL